MTGIGRRSATCIGAIAVALGTAMAVGAPAAHAASADATSADAGWTAEWTAEGADNVVTAGSGQWAIRDVHRRQTFLPGQASATALSRPHPTGSPVTSVLADVTATIPRQA